METNVSAVDATDVHTCQGGDCPECQTRARKDRANEELALAFLLSIVPAITLTLFGNMGLL
jgi:hypothetical protein